MQFIFIFFKGLWFWSGLGECTCKVICQFFLSVFFYMHGDYAAISGTQGLIFSSQNGSSSWGKQSLNIYKWVASSYYLRNLYWQMMTNSPVWLVISYIWWSNMYCNFHDIRVTWIADVSLLLNESRSYDLCTDLTVFSCMNRCWCSQGCLFCSFSSRFSHTNASPVYTQTHTHAFTHRERQCVIGIKSNEALTVFLCKGWRDAVNIL